MRIELEIGPVLGQVVVVSLWACVVYLLFI